MCAHKFTFLPLWTKRFGFICAPLKLCAGSETESRRVKGRQWEEERERTRRAKACILFGFSSCHKYLCHWPQLAKEISFNFGYCSWQKMLAILVGSDSGILNYNQWTTVHTNGTTTKLNDIKYYRQRGSIEIDKILTFLKVSRSNKWIKRHQISSKMSWKPQIKCICWWCIRFFCCLHFSSKLILSIKHSTYIYSSISTAETHSPRRKKTNNHSYLVDIKS